MDVRLFNNEKLTFDSTSKGLRIQLWESGDYPDGHGWMLRSGVVLSAAEIQALLTTLAAVPPESDAGA